MKSCREGSCTAESCHSLPLCTRAAAFSAALWPDAAKRETRPEPNFSRIKHSLGLRTGILTGSWTVAEFIYIRFVIWSAQMPAERTEAIRGAGRAGCGSREEQAFSRRLAARDSAASPDRLKASFIRNPVRLNTDFVTLRGCSEREEMLLSTVYGFHCFPSCYFIEGWNPCCFLYSLFKANCKNSTPEFFPDNVIPEIKIQQHA